MRRDTRGSRLSPDTRVSSSTCSLCYQLVAAWCVTSRAQVPGHGSITRLYSLFFFFQSLECIDQEDKYLILEGRVRPLPGWWALHLSHFWSSDISVLVMCVCWLSSLAPIAQDVCTKCARTCCAVLFFTGDCPTNTYKKQAKKLMSRETGRSVASYMRHVMNSAFQREYCI